MTFRKAHSILQRTYLSVYPTHRSPTLSISSSSSSPSSNLSENDPYSKELEFIQPLRNWNALTQSKIFAELFLFQLENGDRFNIVRNNNRMIDSFNDIRPIVTTKVDTRSGTPADVREFNGNHVHLLGGHHFIATQCPVYEDTFYHAKEHSFFAAIHYNQVCGVVNLMPTTEFEGYRLRPYVTSTEGESKLIEGAPGSSAYRMTCVWEGKQEKDCSFSHHEVSIEGETEARRQALVYVNVSEWPDHGVIESAHLHSLVLRIQSIREKNPPDAPIMIHCRAGVGRTGTIIVADAIHELFKQNKLNKENLNATIATLVWTARLQRGTWTVQTESQMQLLFDYANALLDGKFPN